jgi:hypothetical protein
MYLSVACTSNNYIYIYNATWLVSNLRYVGSHLKSHISGWNRVWWWSQVIHFLVDSPKSPIFSFATSHYYLVSPHSVIKIYIYIYRLIPLFCCFNQRKSKFKRSHRPGCEHARCEIGRSILVGDLRAEHEDGLASWARWLVFETGGVANIC